MFRYVRSRQVAQWQAAAQQQAAAGPLLPVEQLPATAAVAVAVALPAPDCAAAQSAAGSAAPRPAHRAAAQAVVQRPALLVPAAGQAEHQGCRQLPVGPATTLQQ